MNKKKKRKNTKYKKEKEMRNNEYRGGFILLLRVCSTYALYFDLFLAADINTYESE